MSLETTEVTTTEEPITPPPAPAGPASRDDLIAAVRAAGGTGNVDAVAEAPVDGTTPPAADTETPEPAPTRLDGIMKRREQAFADTQAQRAKARQIEEDAERRAAERIREAEERAKKIEEGAIKEHRDAFATSPTAALRKLGLDSQDAIDAVLAENTPHAKLLRQAREDAAAAREDAKIGRTAKEDFEKFKAEQIAQQEAASRAANEQRFMATHATKEAAPNLHQLAELHRVIDPRVDPAQAIVTEARNLAESWLHDGLKYGIDFDDNDVVAYLDVEAKKRLSKLPSPTPPATQVLAGAPLQAPGNAPKVQANGPRTLSAAQGSERRSAPKPFHQLTPQQKREALIEEAAAARRLNPDAD